MDTNESNKEHLSSCLYHAKKKKVHNMMIKTKYFDANISRQL